MTTRGPQIITSINHSANPPTAYAREMSDVALYDALDKWIIGRYVYGKGPRGIEFNATATLQIGRIKRELIRRGLPTDRNRYQVEREKWLADAEQQIADAHDERDTQEAVRYG